MDKCIQVLTEHKSSVYCLASNDGYLYSGDENGWILKWGGVKYIKMQSKLMGHNYGVRCIISHNNYLYSCGGDGLIKKWKNDIVITDIYNGGEIYQNNVHDIIHHDGYIYSGSNKIRKWKDNECIGDFGGTNTWNSAIWCFVSFNHYLYSCGNNNIIQKWKNDECVGVLIGHTDVINCMVIHDDYLYSGSQDKTIRKWKDNECVGVLIGHTERVLCIISYEGCLYSGGADDVVLIWRDDRCVKILKGHTDWVLSIVFHEGHIYSAGHDSRIIKWGEYYPHQYNTLPDHQKEKIKNWRKMKTVLGIQKDIHLMFERELLL